MKNTWRFFCVVYFLLFVAPAFAGTDWQLKMEPQKVFIENKTQFNERNKLAGGEILFATPDSRAQIFFTKNGLTYFFQETKPRHKDEGEEKREREREREKEHKDPNYKPTEKERIEREREECAVTLKTDIVQMQWENSNPNVQVVASEMTPDYQSYGGGSKSVNYVRSYKKLLYKDLYPGIDVEYVFHPVTGIEYSLILHPGADVSQVKMKYSDVPKISTDDDGNIHLATKFGDIIDHAPSTFYAANVNEAITSAFVQKGKTVSFQLGNYDNTKAVIVDPWTQNPLPQLGSQNQAYDIQTDTFGNVYVYGGDLPQRLLKFNSAGTLQWTYNSRWNVGAQTPNYWIGTMITHPTGVCYVTAGSTGEISKVNTAGGEDWFDSGNNNDEYWSMAFNCDYSVLTIGGTRSFNGYALKVNLANGAISQSLRVAGTTPGLFFANPDEIRTICHSPNGNYYFLVLDSIGSFSSGMTLNWRGASTYNIGYAGANYGGATNQGIHAIAATSTNIYTVNGASLHKRDISNGAIIGTATIPGGVTSSQLGFQTASNGGIAIDSCGNIYVGSVNQVVKYDANLTQLATAATPGAVFDVSIGRTGAVVACGNNFVASLSMTACSQVQPICFTTFSANATPTNPQCNGQCTGSATAQNINGTGNISYHWSNNANTQTISNLCPGTYYVTVTDGGGSTATASAIITQPSAFTANASATNTTCGQANGSATTTVTAGTGPYTYAWSNGGSTQTISGIAGGNYTVTISGAGNCTVTATATVNSSTGITISTSTTNSGCASTGSATATITAGSGPFTYSWSSGATTQTATSLAAGPYTVTVSGAGNCSATASAVVNSSGGGITLSSSSTAASCGASNGSASASVTAGTGPFTYHWNNNATTSSISGLAGGTYSVTVSGSGGCSATASVTVTSGTSLTLSTNSTAASCSGSTGSATVTATTGTGPFTYNWSNGQTTQTISGVAGGTYNVTVTGIGNCSATASVTVTSTNGITLTPASTPASCNTSNGSASITAAGTGPFTYSWNTGSTNSSLTGLAGGTYSVTVSGGGGCSATASIVVSSTNGITISTAAVNTSCGNNNGSATVNVTAGTGPFTYLWNTGATTSSISGIAAGTYNVTVSGGGGCSATASATVNPSGNGPVTITSDKTIMCNTDTAHICAPAGYTSYLWNNGKTTQCIATQLAGNYYVTVTDAGGCTATSNHGALTVQPQPPVSMSVSGDTLLSYNALSYQWYLNGNIIPGATSPLFIATQAGSYTVMISDANGCTATSLPVVIVKTGIAEIINENIKVYPNPLQDGNWNLEVGSTLLGSTVEIFDDNGRLVYKAKVKNEKTEIELNVASGIYMLKISAEQKSIAVKLLKL